MGGGDFFGYSLILFAHEEKKINEKPHEIIFMHCWDYLHPFGVLVHTRHTDGQRNGLPAAGADGILRMAAKRSK